jgi:hypothetical protein
MCYCIVLLQYLTIVPLDTFGNSFKVLHNNLINTKKFEAIFPPNLIFTQIFIPPKHQNFVSLQTF